MGEEMKKFEFWTIAYRKRGAKLLLEDSTAAFHIIENTWRYWCADPHLFENEGRTYVFAELYDRVLRRGVIGCCEITDSGYTPWKVILKMPWHLSYPHIFKKDGEIYMIPESYVGNEIALYKATNFPEKWEKVKTLKKDYVAVDSTLFTYKGKMWLQTLQFEKDHELFRLFAVKEDRLSDTSFQIAKDDANKRPAGKLFWYSGKFYRPAQDCTDNYGCALNFYEVTKADNDAYEETLVVKILPTEIRSDFSGVPQGIHTYNLSDKYEIIDLKSYETDWLYPIMRIFWFIYRKLKGAFNR